MKSIYKHLAFCILCGVTFCSCSQSSTKPAISDSVPTPSATSSINEKYNIRTYRNEGQNNGWGYDIYADSALYVHQPHIPALNGTRGFVSETDARSVGQFVVLKLMRNIVPPSVSKQELDSLQIQ
jgi:hypothetical protein